jgi:acyl-CoA thioester hydrolase
MPEPWFATTHKLRFSDCDPVGHVNNAVYSTMFEAGRTDLMFAAGLRLLDGPISMVIVRLEIDFRHEMTWPGDVLIETAVSRLGNKSIHMRQTIQSGGAVSAEALSILAAIDRETRRAIVLDHSWHDRFAPWTLPG